MELRCRYRFVHRKYFRPFPAHPCRAAVFFLANLCPTGCAESALRVSGVKKKHGQFFWRVTYPVGVPLLNTSSSLRYPRYRHRFFSGRPAPTGMFVPLKASHSSAIPGGKPRIVPTAISLDGARCAPPSPAKCSKSRHVDRSCQRCRPSPKSNTTRRLPPLLTILSPFACRNRVLHTGSAHPCGLL